MTGRSLHGLSRRRMLGSAAGLAAWAAPAVIRAAAPVVLQARCGSGSVPSSHSLAIRTIEACSAIDRESDGAIKIQFFGDDSLGSSTAQQEQLRLGALQFMLTSGLGMASFNVLFNIEGLGFAFRNQADVMRAYDGALGARLRSEYPKYGFVAVGKYYDGTPQQLIGYLRPVRTPEDLVGMKVRTTVAPIILDIYSTLGASPVAIIGSQAFTAMQSHVADAAATTLQIIHGEHYDEILKYLSMTNHSWSMYAMLANSEMWRGLPDKYKTIITRNIDKAASRQRVDALNDQKTLLDRIAEKGVAINTLDSRLFSARLGAYYAKYKQLYGPEVWAMVESAVGRLG